MQKEIVPVYYDNTIVADQLIEIIAVKPNVWMTDGLAASRMIRTLVHLGYTRPAGYEVLPDKVRFVSSQTL